MSTLLFLLAIARCQWVDRDDWKCVFEHVSAERVKSAICDEYCHAEHGDELSRCYRRIDDLLNAALKGEE